MTIWPHPIKACIFDNDNTLIDTIGAYDKTHYLTTGHEITNDLKMRLYRTHLYDRACIVIDEYHLNESPQQYINRFKHTLHEQLLHVDLMPGAMEILTELKRRKIRMCIATAASDYDFEKKVSNHQDMIEMMDHVLTSSLVKTEKKSSDMFVLAIDEWNFKKIPIDKNEVLVFEDSPLGIKSANEAGIPSVFIPSFFANTEEEINDIHPIMTIKSLNDFDFSKFKWYEDGNTK